MAKVIACGACRQSLSLPDSVNAGQQIKCPLCQAVMVVPGVAKPVVLPARTGQAPVTQNNKALRTDAMSKPITTPAERPPARQSAPAAPEPVDDEPVVPKATKKKKKKHKETEENTSGKKWVIIGSSLFTLTVLSLIVIFVPWSKIFSGTPEAQRIDVYTAVNSMGYNNVGVRVMDSDTAAYCIPGPRQIMITRPNPKGKYLLLRLKIAYADVEAFYAGARGRLYLNKGNVQVEANGVTKDAVYIQDENADTGSFQMSYQPPLQEGVKVSLRDYLGPKNEAGPKSWTHEGALKEYEENLTFEDNNGMQAMISVGSQRQDGGGGNILEHMTGKKILGNQQGLTGGVGGYVYVTWNMGTGGHIVNNDLEQPNTIGTTWKVSCIVEIPAGATDEVTLKILGKSRRVKIK